MVLVAAVIHACNQKRNQRLFKLDTETEETISSTSHQCMIHTSSVAQLVAAHAVHTGTLLVVVHHILVPVGLSRGTLTCHKYLSSTWSSTILLLVLLLSW